MSTKPTLPPLPSSMRKKHHAAASIYNKALAANAATAHRGLDPNTNEILNESNQHGAPNQTANSQHSANPSQHPFISDPITPNPISLSICTNLFSKLQSDLSSYLTSKLPLLKAELEKRQGGKASSGATSGISGTSSDTPSHHNLMRDFFAYRTTETYSSTLRLINQLATNTHSLSLFYLMMLSFLPERVLGADEKVWKGVKESGVFAAYEGVLRGGSLADQQQQKQSLLLQFSFGNWISTSEMRELVVWGDTLYLAIAQMPSDAQPLAQKKKGKKPAQPIQQQPTRSFTHEVLEMLVTTICADVLSVILRSFEMETVHNRALHGGNFDGMRNAALDEQQERRRPASDHVDNGDADSTHPNDVELGMDDDMTATDRDAAFDSSSLFAPSQQSHHRQPSTFQSAPVHARQTHAILSNVLNSSLHLLQYIQFWRTQQSSVDTWTSSFGKRPFYQWCYVMRRLSMFDFPLLISTLCGYVNSMRQHPEALSQMLLYLEILKYVDVQVDSVRNNETFQKYLDFLLSMLNQWASAGAPAPTKGKKSKKNAPPPSAASSQQIMVKIRLLEALLSVYSQLDFEKQRISHLQVKTNNVYQRVLQLTNDPDLTTRNTAFQLACTIIAHARFEWYNDVAEDFTDDLLRRMHPSVAGNTLNTDWVLFACLARILEDKRNININIRFVDLFSIDDDHLERNPDFVTLVYAESNKHVDEFLVSGNAAGSESHLSTRDDESNAPDLDTSVQAHEKAKFEYQAVRNRLFKMITEPLFRSKNSILVDGISVDDTFDVEIFHLSWMVLRLAQISLEQVTQNLLPELLSMTVAQNNPQTIMLGLRVLRMFVCTSEKAKVDDTATFTPHMLYDLRMLHRMPNYDRFAEEVVRKNFIHVQKIIEFCDKELGVDLHNQLTVPIPVSSYLHPVKFEDLYHSSIVGSSTANEQESGSSLHQWKDAEQEAFHSLSGYSFFSVAQMALNQAREQRANNRDDASTVFTADTDVLMSPVSPSGGSTPGWVTPATPMSPAGASKKPALKLLIERNMHLLKVDQLASPSSGAGSTPTPTSASNKKKKSNKTSKKNQNKQQFSVDEKRALLFKIYLEVFRCIPFIVPEQLIKTVDPTHFIGSRLAYNDSLIATACSQALQRILCERKDLRAFVIEGCVMLLQSDMFDSNEASLITVLDNITLMLEFWSDINRREIAEMFCDINQTNEQIIGQLKASRWNERKAWIDKVETVAASCLCSSSFRLRRSALATLKSLSELIESEKVDSLSGIEKHWKRRPTLHDILLQHEPSIIQAAVYNLQLEDSFYCDDFSLDALKWSDEMATLHIPTIAQRDDCHLLWNLILVEIIKTCQTESYTKFLVPLLELVRRRSERLVAADFGVSSAEYNNAAEIVPPPTLRDEQDRAMYWTNLMSVFFAGAGSDSPTDLQSIHSEVTAILEGGVSRGVIWQSLSNNIHDWISTGVVKSVSKVHPDSAHLVIQSVHHWLESANGQQEQEQTPQTKKKKKSKGASQQKPSSSGNPSVFHMTDLCCRLCYNLSTHSRRLSDARLDAYQLLLTVFHQIRLTFASNGHELFRAPNQLVKYLESELYFCNALLYLGRAMIVLPNHRLSPLMQPYPGNPSLQWKDDELTQNVVFLQEVSGYTPKARLRHLSQFMEHLLSDDSPQTNSGGKKSKKKSAPTPVPSTSNTAARAAYREEFQTLATKIQNTSQEAISQLAKLNSLSLFDRGMSQEEVMGNLLWFQGAEQRGYHVLAPLLSLHFDVLIETYLEQVYSSQDASVAVLYIRAIHETLFPRSSQHEIHVPTTSTVDHAVRFIKTQHDIYHNKPSSMSDSEGQTIFEKQVQNNKIKFLVLILWSCFHPHDEIHSHAYEMACDYVQTFYVKDNNRRNDDMRDVLAQLRKYSSSFKTRSVTSLSQSAHSISRILSTVFLNHTIQVFGEVFSRFSTIFGPQGQLWCLKLLTPWGSGLLIASQEIVNSVVSPLFDLTIPLYQRFSFTSDMQDLWVNLAGAYERSTDSTPNLALTVQFLKNQAQEASESPVRLRVCREIVVCIFNAFPQMTLDLLLVELKLTKYPQISDRKNDQGQPGQNAAFPDVDENASVTSHLSQFSSTRVTQKAASTSNVALQQQNPTSPHVPAITQLMNMRKAIILLITDIVCEAKHVEYIFQNLPIIFTFILCFFDDIRLRESEFQKLLLNLLLRMGSSQDSQEWNMLCRMLSQNETVRLNWNHKRQSFHQSVKKEFAGTEYESSCRKLLPVLEGEIYAVDLIKIFMETIKSSLSPKIVDAIGEHAMLCALNVLEPQELYRHLMIYHTSMKTFSQNQLNNVTQCLIMACEMAEVRMEDAAQYETTAKCIQLCMKIIKQYTMHYNEAGVLHMHELIFWTSVAMMNYPFNDIYAEALQIMEIFSDYQLCQQRFFNLFTTEEEASVPIADWIHPYTGLPILLINGFNRSQFEKPTLRILLNIVQISSESTGGTDLDGHRDFPLHLMENLLTIFLMLLVWMHREDIRNPTYEDDHFSLKNACQALNALTRAALPHTKLSELIDFTILRRSKDLFFSNVCSQICAHFFPLQSKQAVEELLCMLISGQKRHQLAIIEIVKHLLRSASHETVETFTPLVTSCMQLTNSKVANSSDLLSGLSAKSSMLQQSIIDLLSVVSDRSQEKSEDEFVDDSFALPSAEVHGLALDLKSLMKRLEMDEATLRLEKESHNGVVEQDDGLESLLDRSGFRLNTSARNSPRNLSTPKHTPVGARTDPMKIGFPSLVRAAMAFNHVRKNTSSLKTPSRPSPLPTVVDFRQNLERNMEEEQQGREERVQLQQQAQRIQQQNEIDVFRRFLRHKADYGRRSGSTSPASNTRQKSAAEHILSIIEDDDDVATENTNQSIATLVAEPLAGQDQSLENDSDIDEDEADSESGTELEISVQDEATQQQLLSPIAASSILLKSFSSLEGLSMTMSPMRRAPEPPKRRAPMPRLRPAPKPFNKPRKVEEVLNDSVTFSYFKSFCLRSELDPSLLAFYEDVREFMNQTNLTSSRVKADAIISKYFSIDSEYFVDELNGQTRTRILQAYNRNPQTPSKLLFSSAIEWILSIFDSYFDLFLESEEYEALKMQQMRL